MKDKDLESLGFKKRLSPYTGKYEWGLGSNRKGRGPIIHYKLETSIASTIMGQFTVIERECDTLEEIKKFIECIKFLYPETAELLTNKTIT